MPTIFGSKLPSRSRGTSISTGPTSVSTLLPRRPLREFSPVAADRVVLGVAEMIVELALQRRLDHRLGQPGHFGALKGRYFGPRPLIEDDSVRSQSSLIFNARAGYKFDNGLRLQLDVLNLFNANTNQIEYYYLSRLPGEPIGGVADRHVHPAEPLAVRLTLAGKF